MTRGTARQFDAFYRSNRARVDFSGSHRAVPRGTARYVNASIEIHVFDYGGAARYRAVPRAV